MFYYFFLVCQVPGFTFITPSPTLSTIPAPSCPNTTGKTPSGSKPPNVKASVWHTAVCEIFIRTSCALGGATSISSILSGSLAAHATAALHLITYIIKMVNYYFKSKSTYRNIKINYNNLPFQLYHSLLRNQIGMN